MKETMRIFPPIPVVERELQNDFQMGPYLLPKGSEVFITPHLVQHNPEVSSAVSQLSASLHITKHMESCEFYADSKKIL